MNAAGIAFAFCVVVLPVLVGLADVALWFFGLPQILAWDLPRVLYAVSCFGLCLVLFVG